MKVTVRFTLEVPDGTDPQRVVDEAQKSVDSEIGHGGLCQWGNWDVGEVELADVEQPGTPASGKMSADITSRPGDTAAGS